MTKQKDGDHKLWFAFHVSYPPWVPFPKFLDQPLRKQKVQHVRANQNSIHIITLPTPLKRHIMSLQTTVACRALESKNFQFSSLPMRKQLGTNNIIYAMWYSCKNETFSSFSMVWDLYTTPQDIHNSSKVTLTVTNHVWSETIIWCGTIKLMVWDTIMWPTLLRV